MVFKNREVRITLILLTSNRKLRIFYFVSLYANLNLISLSVTPYYQQYKRVYQKVQQKWEGGGGTGRNRERIEEHII